jgi:hypothetical protein
MTNSSDLQTQEDIEVSQAQFKENEAVKWFDSDSQPDEAYSINEYEITTSPNDFNIKTMYDLGACHFFTSNYT